MAIERGVDNTVYNRGNGNWKIVTYRPQGSCGIINGTLHITKDFHYIMRPIRVNGVIEQTVVANFPNQNVALAYLPECVNEHDKTYEDKWPTYVVSSEQK